MAVGTLNDERAVPSPKRAAGPGPSGVLEEPHGTSIRSTDKKDKEEEEDEYGDGNDTAPTCSGTSESNTNADEEGGARELEATTITTTQTNSPPFTTFSIRQRRFIVFMVAWGGFFSPLSANIYFPALNTLSRDFNVSSTLINLTLTSYMIFQGLAPTFFGDLADMAGRRPAYAIGFIIYIGACIGIALCDSYAALFVLRCLQSSGSSGTIALGNGVVADIATSAERGTWMGWATAGPMIGYSSNVSLGEPAIR